MLSASSAIDYVVVGRPSRLRNALVKALEEQGDRLRVFNRVDEVLTAETGLVPGLLLLGPVAGSKSFAKGVVELKRVFPLIDVVSFAEEVDAQMAVGAIRAGARDFLVGANAADFLERIDLLREQQRYVPPMQQLRDRLVKRWRFEGIISRNQKLWELFEVVEQVAPTDATVLLLGETGTGKDLLAHAIHRRSRRRSDPFLAVDCGAMSETLLDSELFGHEKGAFTGANARRIGLFEQADGGTLFLDEIGNVTEAVQQRLLRVLETGRVRRVGGGKEIATDVRIIAATNLDLGEAVQQGEFREDLFYRLNVIQLAIPPLRERPEDVLLLLNHFLGLFARRHRMKKPRPTDRVVDLLLAHDWPGNVRELQNLAERLVLVAQDGRILARHLPNVIRAKVPIAERRDPLLPDVSLPLAPALDPIRDRAERNYLERLLRAKGGRIQECADHAGISRRTLYRKMKALGLDKDDFKDPTVVPEDD